MNLTDYGFDPTIQEINDNESTYIPARVVAVHRERFELVSDQGFTFGRLKPGVYYNGGDEAFPTAGDFVIMRSIDNGDSQIIKTLPRRSFFSRRDPSPGRGGQAVAANFDYVFIMQSLNRDFNLRRLERTCTLALQSRAVPVIVLTKADLAEDYSGQVRAAQKAAAGIGVYTVSVKTGAGLDALADYLKPRKTVVCLGSSGVGKSSLINALAGEEIMAVGGIREEDGRGRHTTTHRHLIMLRSGVMVIDTPGMRELGLWDAAGGLSETFSDVERTLGQCRFSDCKHNGEPGCAVRAAIARGDLSPGRWESYMKLSSEADGTDVKGTKQKRRKETEKSDRQREKPDYRHTACLESFTCKVCGTAVMPEGSGSQHRNHCPKCLSSVHVDNEPGDRASLCKGTMDPIGVWVRKNGEWAIIHRCRLCGVLSSNRIAADDNPALLLSIAVKPLAMPPFPLGNLEQRVIDNASL